MTDLKENIFLYDGEGSSEQSVQMAYHTFSVLLQNTMYKVHKISPEVILKGGWESTAALLILGGGYDLGYINALGSKGMAMVRNYVEHGGSYLGICAGGYFGCDYIEFDKNGPLEVCGDRDLKFYEGGCIGPVYPGFAYQSEKGAHAVPVSWDISNVADGQNDSSKSLYISCYFNGGGYFTKPDSSFRGEILGRYGDTETGKIAILKNLVGQGTVVLSGVHFEYEPNLLDASDIYLKERNIIPVLRKSLQNNYAGLRSILKHLHLLCR